MVTNIMVSFQDCGEAEALTRLIEVKDRLDDLPGVVIHSSYNKSLLIDYHTPNDLPAPP